MKMYICLVLVLAAAPVMADVITLSAPDTLGQSSFNSGLHWSDGLAPSAGNNYEVSIAQLRTPVIGDSYTFGGDSLTINPDGALWYKGTGATGSITIHNLVANGGTVMRHTSGSGDVCNLHGNIYMAADSVIYAKQGPINVYSTISGSGTITNPGSDGTSCTLTFCSPDSTFTGSIVNNGRFALAENAVLNFVIGANGVNNSISGTGTATFDGVFQFDLTAASTNIYSVWTIADVATQSFGSTFAVAGFTRMNGNIWTKEANGIIYQFYQNTGILAAVSSGSGTFDDPFPIWTPQELNVIGTSSPLWDKCFKLMADIDMTGVSYNIIGNSTIPFTGIFDGNGHVISNVTIEVPSQDSVGLFGEVGPGGQINNLGVENVNIKGNSSVGGLVGFNESGTITACYVTGTVSGSSYVGGLAGYNHNNSTIWLCYATGAVSGSSYVGGLVGYINGSNLMSCYAAGAVSGSSHVGGLAGYYYPGTLMACFWDTQTSGTTDGVGDQDPDPAGVIGKTTAQMKTVSTFIDAGWDFSADDGDPADWYCLYYEYPRLAWQTLSSSGSGTIDDPWQIWTPQQMNTIGLHPEDWASHFILMADIDMTGVSYNIIGNNATYFTGTFDGNGHVISNLTAGTPSQEFVGLFGRVGSGGQIVDLGVENVNINGYSYIGGLVGHNYSSTITACYVTGTVSGSISVGGLVGNNICGTITNCYAAGTVSGSGSVGGLVGQNDSGTITACYATSTVSSSIFVGGLVGYNNSGGLTDCYAAGTVSGSSSVGGLVGYNAGSLVACYAAATVSGSGYNIGGLVGYNYSSTLTDCYATGPVSGTVYVGGLVGYEFASTFTSCFWDTQTSGQSSGVGEGDSTGVTGQTTAQMKTVSTFTNAGWDFSADDGDPADWFYSYRDYPRLIWQTTGTPDNSGSGTIDDPWQIRTPQQMNTIGLYPEDWASHFILMADIDMTGLSYNIIGNFHTTYFTGTFDGNGHVISNVTVGSPSQEFVGLFAALGSGGQIRNLGVENVNFSGSFDVGGLVGFNQGTITNCSVAGTVSGTGAVGGLVGDNSQGTITNCHTAGTFSASGTFVGGLVGLNESGAFTSSYAAATVSGSGFVGGLMGGNYGTITSCYATGAAGGSYFVGGLVGYNYSGTLTDCYAAGPVSGSIKIGGLVGSRESGTFTFCFWDTQTSGQSSGVGEGDSTGVTGQTTSQMKTRSTFTGAGWDFTNEIANGTSNFWRLCADDLDYPALSWQSSEADMACPDGVAIDDFGALAAQWMQTPCDVSSNNCGRADMDSSGTIDTADLMIFAGHWLEEM